MVHLAMLNPAASLPSPTPPCRYTGLGGRWAPLGAELISPPFETDPSWVQSGEVAIISLCPSATNGGRPNADGVCELPPPVAAAAAGAGPGGPGGPGARRLLRA